MHALEFSDFFSGLYLTILHNIRVKWSCYCHPMFQMRRLRLREGGSVMSQFGTGV